MKILIIGAKGNLGVQLAEVFKEGNELLLWDFEDLDITDQAKAGDKIGQAKPDIIINAAAYNAVDKCEESEREFELAKKINGLAVGYLADEAIRCKALLVHYSTDYVFSGHTPAVQLQARQNGGFDEEHPTATINRYAATKLMGEDEIMKRKGKKLKFYLIRTSLLFGPRGQSETAKPSFFDLVINKSKMQNELTVVDDEVSSFTYTPDLAQATFGMVKAKKKSGIYHITNSGQASWYEGATALFGMLNSDVIIRPVSGAYFFRPAKRSAYCALKNTKLPALRPYQDALREYLKI